MSSYETDAISTQIIELYKDEARWIALSHTARKRVGDFEEDLFKKNY